MLLYIANLTATVVETDLRELFAPFGEVGSVVLVHDRFTGVPRGLAYVTMPNDEHAHLAAEQLSGMLLFGQPLHISCSPHNEQPVQGQPLRVREHGSSSPSETVG